MARLALLCLSFVVWLAVLSRIEPPPAETGRPELHPKYDARAQLKNACTAYLKRVDLEDSQTTEKE